MGRFTQPILITLIGLLVLAGYTLIELQQTQAQPTLAETEAVAPQ
jgi:hypothetical protein